ncbi:MAG: M3 family oligoendopeptidase [Phycisphaerales bacterium]|nr:MAG: M3 family oligoendopeptidase [Phycisphaerales bacterium]
MDGSMTTTTATTDFVPTDLDATQWKNLEPLYQSLIDRPLKCEDCVEQLILDRSELDAAASEAESNLYIRMTCNTSDEKAKKGFLNFVENVEPQLKKAGFALDKKIAECEHTDKLDQHRYSVLIRNIRADVELFREENIPLQTEDTKLGQQYEEICGAMTVEFRGEEKTLPQMAKFFELNDRETREEAWRAVAERRAQDTEKIDEIFDKLIKLRHQMAQNAGFDNYRDYMFKAMHRFDYTPEDCEAFHRGAEEVCVPVYRKLNEQRAETLGLTKTGESLRPWDLAVDPKGRDPLTPFDDADELIERTSKLFHRMSPDLGEMFDTLREGDCLDLESRKGKAPGGYQSMRDRIRKPFIFMNAAGLQRDLETMVHEAGHAFHSLLCKDDPLVYYRHAPIEFAEVASMSMELFAHPYMTEFYDEDGANRARRQHLEDLSKMLPWIATIDAFQHWIYTNPDHTRDQRTAKWLELDDRFGAKVDWSGMEPYRASAWHRQLHLFRVPFYYIEYGIAQLGSLQLWRQSRENGEDLALKNYRNAMALGGSKPLPDLFAAAELKFDFGPETMRTLMSEVEKELGQLPR